jgi:nucleotide-binding universal stress UspA family protein
MTTNYRMVVGVDGSEGGERALRWAVREAAHREGATVLAVTAYSVDRAEGSSLWYREQAATKAQDLLGAQVATALNDNPRVSVTTHIVQGAAVETLLDAAETADLLVLGSHGHGRLFHAVLGSVAEACLRRSSCPVLVVPTPRPPRAHTPAEPNGIPAGIL